MKKKLYGVVGNGFDSRTGYEQTPANAGVLLLAQVSRAKTRAIMKHAALYKPARLYAGNHREWYIEYYFLKPDGSGFKRFKERFDIGRIRSAHGDAAAIAYGQECVQLLNASLANGMNPFTDRKVVTNDTAAVALKKLVHELVADATINVRMAYQENYNRLLRFCPYVEKEGFGIGDFTSMHAQQFVDALDAAALSPKTINASITHMHLFWREMKKKQWVHDNVWQDVSRIKRKVASDRYEPFTVDEINTVFAHLKKIDQGNFLTVAKFVLYAWIRPGELRKLKVGDIDIVNKTIRVPAEAAKAKKGAYVQIVPQLMETISSMHLEKYDASLYLFSQNKLLPGKLPLNKNSLVDRWQLWVIDKIGIKKTMYALKHTGNIMYLQNNKGSVDLKWQQMQNRHSSAAMTERYIRELGAYFIDVSKITI